MSLKTYIAPRVPAATLVISFAPQPLTSHGRPAQRCNFEGFVLCTQRTRRSASESQYNFLFRRPKIRISKNVSLINISRHCSMRLFQHCLSICVLVHSTSRKPFTLSSQKRRRTQLLLSGSSRSSRTRSRTSSGASARQTSACRTSALLSAATRNGTHAF